MTSARQSTRLLPLLADVGCVLAFALGGRSTHESGDTLGVLVAIWWPFALAAALAHAGLVVAARATTRVWPEGVVVVAVTYLLGMALRIASGRGTAGGFLVVAALFLLATMLGWRVLTRLVTRRRTTG